MAKKAPRRTAERILEVSLGLFNRFGEPNVSTTLIANELSISPGNLYYHYPSKDELINVLFNRFETQLRKLLDASTEVRDVEDTWFVMHSLFELVWESRFLYRDLNDLLSKNRWLETHWQQIIRDKVSSFATLLNNLRSHNMLVMDDATLAATANNMVVMLTYWLSFEYVQHPREALEPAAAQASVLRGAHHTLNLLTPYLQDDAKNHLQHLVSAYT
jgi:AcrR family transcriptional regulator